MLLQTSQQFVLLERPVLLQFALFDQGKQRLQQRILWLAVKQRAQHPADNGKLIHDNTL